jgi:ribA/ribD-fused uncharacterized protein
VDWDRPVITESDLPRPSDFATFHPFLKGVFSQWHLTRFELEGRAFVTAEQWMMFAKADLFGDIEAAEAILATDDPGEQKRLGQQVRGFDTEAWSHWRVDIVYRGSRAKFGQNDGARRQLLATTPAMLVEANSRDWNWGCGLAEDDPALNEPSEWRGSNLLGRILTHLRAELS